MYNTFFYPNKRCQGIFVLENARMDNIELVSNQRFIKFLWLVYSIASTTMKNTYDLSCENHIITVEQP